MSVDDDKTVLTPSFSPHKVVLLALVAAYCAGILPKKTHRPLLVTIVKYIEGPSVHSGDTASVSIPTLDEILRNVKDACRKADPEEGAIYANDIELRVLHALWSLQSLDSLHTFITRAKSLLVDNLTQGKQLIDSMPVDAVTKYLLTKSSFLGNFVLNSITSFESLEFDRTTLLWSSFVRFRESSERFWKEKGKSKSSSPHDLFGSTNKDDNPELLQSLIKSIPFQENTETHVNVLSQEDLSKLIEHQVHILETYGTPALPEFKNVLMRMTQSDTGKLPSIHYINFLECSRNADYEGAFNALHRYFDYMMSNRQTVFYHYALLSLATLHASFNCEGEAIRAIEESIAVARENKDTACLNFLLTWVFNFLKDRPHLKHKFYVSNDQLLQFLKSKSGDSSNALHSIAYQSDATQLMLEGGSLVSIIESLTKSLYISLNGDTVLTSFRTHCSLTSSFWYRTGNFHLAEVYADIALQSGRSIPDLFESSLRKAHLEFEKGNIEECFHLLDEQKKLGLGDIRLIKELQCNELLLLAEQGIRSCNYRAAEVHLSKLQALDLANIDLEGQVSYLVACLNLKTGNIEKAFHIASERLTSFANRSSNRYWFVKFSLLLCQIMARGSRPARVLSSSIQCLRSASSSGYGLLAHGCVLLLVDILIRLDQYEDAKILIYQSLPKFAESANLELISKAHKSIARILVEQATRDGVRQDEQINHLVTTTIQSLEIAIDGFKRISNFEEIRECLQLQLKVGTMVNHQEIIEHAKSSIENVKSKIDQNSY